MADSKISPRDYKSENKGDAFLPESVAKIIHARLESQEIAAERARLEREALRATTEYRQYFFPPGAAKDLKPDSPGNRFLIAIDALLEFEAKQK